MQKTAEGSGNTLACLVKDLEKRVKLVLFHWFVIKSNFNYSLVDILGGEGMFEKLRI